MWRFEEIRDELEATAADLEPRRALFLLAYAQRLRPLYELFEERAPKRPTSFAQVLELAWSGAADGTIPTTLLADLDASIPGEDWVVNGFYDTLAQNVGGLAFGALEGLTGSEIELWPEFAVIDTIRLLLAEMRLACTEPGDNAIGDAFDGHLHLEPLFLDEVRFWQALVAELQRDDWTIERVRAMAIDQTLDLARILPELERGLAQDAADALEWMSKSARRDGA